MIEQVGDDRNEYDDDGEVILDNETRLLYVKIQLKARLIQETLMEALNRADTLRPSDRRQLIEELNRDFDVLVEKVKKAAKDQ